MAEKFEVSRVEAKAYVKTPFPVCQNVWADFVMKIFPDFVVPPEQMHRNYYHGKHLNRMSKYDEIADGQGGYYYRHAYLPHGDRYFPGRVEVSGLIHVPNCRISYLNQIQAGLEENPRSRTALLDSIRQVNAETIGYLIKQLIQAPGTTTFRDVKTARGLRDVFGKELARSELLDGCYNDPGSTYINAYAIDQIPIGQLPLSMKGQNIDFLRSQTCLDFLRDLDDIVIGDVELTKTDLAQIPEAIKKRYSDIVRVLKI